MQHHQRVFSSGGAGLVALLLVLTGCGGGGDDDADSTAKPVDSALSTTSSVATVVIPVGVSVTADKLSVVTSIDQTKPDVSGNVTIARYDNGEQLAIALSPNGKPMLMGWLDATHTTISAATTAHVLAYFALGGVSMLHDLERQTLIADIPGAPGIDALEATVRSELAANVDAFGQADSALRQALDTFATALYTAAQSDASSAAGRTHALGISITPDVQSGINVIQDPPFALHLTNSYRRRVHAFVERVSHTPSGANYDVPDPLSVTDFDIAPVVGVSGGVTGALADIMSAYYGNQPTAYANISAPDDGGVVAPVAVPLVDGSDKTTYRVTVVGPGSAVIDYNGLTDEQKLVQSDVAWRGWIKDAVVPWMANVILGSGFIDFTAGQATTNAEIFADIATSLSADSLVFDAAWPGIRDKVAKGQWFDAGVDLTSTVVGSNTLSSLLVGAFQVAVNKYNAGVVEADKITNFMKSFDTIMDAAGGVLQGFDSVIYLKDVGGSHNTDVWTITVVPSKVALNPAASNVGVGGTVVLTASVLDVENTAGYSYHWTTTTQFGDLNEIAGGSRTHQTDYCSSSNEALFVYEHNTGDGTVDTISVDAYPGADCDPAKGDKLGSASATVTLMQANGRTIYGGPGGYDCGITTAGGNIPNDDSITFYLNDTQVFASGYTGCAGIPPVVLPDAKQGDIVRVVVSDEGGHHSGVSGLYMLHNGEYVLVDPGFNRDTPNGKDNGVQYDHSFSIPF